MDANGVGRPGVAVSTDNGLSWVVRTVPTPRASARAAIPLSRWRKQHDLSWLCNVDGHAKIASSADRGLHWSKSKDAGTPFGVQNAEFGGSDRRRRQQSCLRIPWHADDGDTQSADFLGVWHLYVAFTYNTGRTWTTVDAAPSDAVQRGCIWNGGGSNPCRNLLDFNDITVDKTGRVLVGYADGCTGSCVSDSTQNATAGPATAQGALATIARQVGGRGCSKHWITRNSVQYG